MNRIQFEDRSIVNEDAEVEDVNMENTKCELKESLSEWKYEDNSEVARSEGKPLDNAPNTFARLKLVEEMDLSPIDARRINCIIPFHDQISYLQRQKIIETVESFKGLRLESGHGLPSRSGGNGRVDGNDLKKQKFSSRAAERIFKCAECQKSFARKTYLINHMRMHTGETFNCAHCPFSTCYKSSLVIHMAKHTGKFYKCEFCEKKFCSKSTAKDHVAAKHERAPIFKCDACSSAFTSRYHLHNHFTHGKCSASNPRRCSYCPFETFSMDHLVAHTAEHGGRGALSCSLCPFSCESKFAMAAHSRKHAEKPHRCPTCPLMYREKSRLEKHMRSHGENQALFACAKCSYKSRFKSNLNTHLRVHEKARPFACPHCSYASRFRSNLRSHVAHVHSLTSKKRVFSCHMCSFATCTVLELAAHMRMHIEGSPSDGKSSEEAGAS